MQLCEYGCGREAKQQFQNGKWCCSEKWIQCPFQRETLRKRMAENNPLHDPEIKKKHDEACQTKEFRDLQKKNILSRPNPMSDHEIKNKHSKSMKKISGKNNPLHTCEGALERLRKTAATKESRKRKSEGTKRAVVKGIHPSKLDTLDDYKRKYPFLLKVEELRVDANGNIEARCKNHKCKNSKQRHGWFKPTSYQLHQRAYMLEDGKDNSYLYCSEQCKIECFLFGKSPIQLLQQNKQEIYTYGDYQLWRKVVLERDEYKCQYCEKEAKHVHHIEPQKLQPQLSLDPDNGLSVCKECHYKYGHKGECSTGALANIVCK
ncbi:HNH endonuclease [Candidatus Pacearchaeota archaeon]|nr:HNH endonuclease [Candidatus Pacearchaeota archaeon]